MLSKSLKIAGFALAGTIVLCLATIQGHSEIAVTGVGTPTKAGPLAEPPAAVSQPGKQSAPLWVQCWQYGVKIIDEKNLFGIRVQSLIERDSLGFSGRDGSNGEVYVIPIKGDSTCLIKPLR